ncbi:hypothetical protein L6164_005974 [Bauhinia variegata]|uniref:Uncharacterized protein n=1 Tax=Bauhinia variegata TaxID=167791 RepID=A0ACB9PVL5_BAUVA|nr:hypothetical protein L6164_005974 [Bauhinia variegata]
MSSEEKTLCCVPDFWLFLVLAFVLVVFAAITSGLALGLLSFSQVDLEVLVKAGQPQTQKNAAKIMPIVKNEHLLLCTLLICKSLALEGVSVSMEKIFPEWLAVIISATFVGIIAEIIPQALCSRYGLSVGAKLSLFVQVLLLVFFPLSYPISKLLDWVLGKGHTALLGRAELKTMVNLHANEAGKGGELSRHETTIISGALDLTQKTAKDAMTPISETFSLDIDSKLDMNTMNLIMSKGYSRIPIHSGKPTNIIGLILVKNLIFLHPEDEMPIKYLTIRRIPRVDENWPLYDILNIFQRGQSHMAVVEKDMKAATAAAEDYLSISTDASNLYSEDSQYYSTTLKNIMELQEGDSVPKQSNGSTSNENSESLSSQTDEKVIGIITLEDVIEELLQGDILDETDQYVDVHRNIKIDLQRSRRVSLAGSFRGDSSSRNRWRGSDQSRISPRSPSTHS